ncbi:MAG: ketoacyl-ACP synthase III [Elusimicrobia bacterium]|nr:ketoacyl-ACP synthase III [Elusimicrobiota bacterium]
MLGILGLGWYLPKTELDNDFLHKEVGLEKDQDWIESRLGIERRYSVLSKEYILKTKNADPSQAITHARANGETPVTMGLAAARMAIKQAGIRPEQIGWVVANSDTPFDFVPMTASLIARELGVGTGPHCDMNSACSSFARHMKGLADTQADNLPEFILCVQSSCYTTRTDYRSNCIDGYIMGDGAAAQLVSAKHAGLLTAEPMIFDSKPSEASEIVSDACGHFTQNGAAVRKFSIRKTCEMFEEIAERKGLYADKVYTITHQANAVMQESILGHLNLPPERHLSNVREQGNIASAGCPSVLAQNIHRLHKGDQIVYAVLGAGLAWGGGYMEVQ